MIAADVFAAGHVDLFDHGYSLLIRHADRAKDDQLRTRCGRRYLTEASICFSMVPMKSVDPPARARPPGEAINIIRSFNRRYTRQLGLLDTGLLGSEFTLTEARVLYELANCGDSTATQIAGELGLDLGYMSRLIKKFARRRYIKRTRSPVDARQSRLQFTEILAGFVKNYDSTLERGWVAERDGGIIGSVFLVRASADVAKLRLLYVEPAARGLGLGRRLVQECIDFARIKGYKTLTLWTNDVLVSARRIYQAAGFRLAKEERHRSFGKELVGQTWDLAL